MLGTLIIILLCVVAILSIPVELTFSAWRDRAFASRLTLVWLFGLVRITVPLKRSESVELTAAETGKTRADAKTRRNKSKRRRAVRKIMLDPRLGWHILGFVRELFLALHISRLSINLRLGLDDPADTGRLWALIGPLAMWLKGSLNADVVVVPEFSGEALVMDGRGQMKIIPMQLIYLVLAFVLSPVMMRTVWRSRAQGA